MEYYLLPLSETYICLGDTVSPFKRICFSLHFKIIAMKEHNLLISQSPKEMAESQFGLLIARETECHRKQ